MEVILRTPYFVVTKSEPHHLFYMRRTRTPYSSVGEMEVTLDAIAEAMGAVERSAFSVVVDTRASPMRTDPEFEEAFATKRKKLLAGFARVVIVAQTAVGRLQIHRYANEERRRAPPMFGTPAEALAHLGLAGRVEPPREDG